MRFNVSAASAAIISAICLTVPFVASADIGQPARFSITAEPCGGHSTVVFEIRNDGGDATGFAFYRITARAAENMPALRTWDLVLPPLKHGSVFYVMAPSGAWGLKLSLELSSDRAGTQILARTEAPVPYPNFCW